MMYYMILAWRYLSGRKLRTTLTTLAIALGVMILFGLSSVLPAMMQSFRSQMLAIAGEVDLTIGHVSGGPFSPRVLETARGTEGVVRAAGILRQNILLPDTLLTVTARQRGINSVTVVGMDPDPAQLVRPVDLVDGRFLQLGDTTTVVISQRLAEVLGLRVGDVLHLPGAAGQVPLTVIGVLRATPVPGPEAVYVTIETAQRILNLPGLINGIEVMVQAGVEREAVQARLLERLGPGYTTTLPEFGQEFATSMQLGERIFQTIGILALIMGGFIIFNTFRTVVAERRHDLGMLRAIGATRRMVLTLILTESLLQGILGTFLGLLAGYGLAQGTFALLRPTMREFLRFELGAPTFTLESLVVAISMGIGVTLLSGLWPAMSATRLTPLDALRPTLPPVQHWQARLRAIVGSVLIGLAFLGLMSGQVGLSALGVVTFIVGLVLISPALVQPLADLLSSMLVVLLAREGQLARGNVSRQPERAAITASTVMISLAIIVAAGGIITSLSQGLTLYIQRSLGADILVMPSVMVLGAGNLGANPSLAASIRQVPGVQAVTTLRLGKAIVDGQVLQVVGLDPQTYPQVSGLVFSSSDPQSAFAALSQGRTIILNGVYAVQAGAKVGQVLTLQTPEGPKDYTVVGMAVDFLNAKIATGYISQANLANDFHITSDVLLMANLVPGVEARSVRHAVETLIADYPTFAVIDSKTFRETTLTSSQAGFMIMYILMLILAVPSLLAMINTLAINVIERTREIGLLRAIGSTRRQIRRIIQGESLLLASMGTAFGLISGVWLGYVLIGAMNVGGFPMPYTFPYAGLLLGLAGGILLGILAASLPARQAAHLNIINALRYE